MTLVDTNIIIDILASDPKWREWSLNAMKKRSAAGAILINEIVYAELAARYDSQSTIDIIIEHIGVQFERIPKAALFAAGRTFQEYRNRRGTRSTLLPDFFIGAHAATSGIPILTRDVRRYTAYFPSVELIAPD